MLPHRKLLFVLAFLGVGGSLSGTLAYGLYLRSDLFRARLEDQLSNQLHLPVRIGRVQPLTGQSRAFYDLRVALPMRHTEVFRCASAIWHTEPYQGQSAYALDLTNGWMLIGTDQWSGEDYQAIVRSGLGQDFARMNLKRVHLDGIDLEWRHPEITMSIRGAVGELHFDDEQPGRAALRANNLNGYPVDDSISIAATFTPGRELRFHEVRLDLPHIPFSRLGLESLLGAQPEHGAFRGRVLYRSTDQGPSIELAGLISDARLEELTEPLIGGPFEGQIDVVLDLARIRDRNLDALRFRGEITDLSVGQLLPMLGASGLDSRAQLRVHQAELIGPLVKYFSATGLVSDLPLQALSQLLGKGTITGNLRVEIRSIVVVDDVLQRAEIECTAIPPKGQAGTIDKALLDLATRKLLGYDMTAVLPEHIEYVKLGALLEIEGNQLRLRGTHGHDGKTLLTIKVLGQQIPVVRESKQTYDIGPVVQMLRDRVEQYELEHVRRMWEGIHTPNPQPQGEER